jgi:magnesium transporter
MVGRSVSVRPVELLFSSWFVVILRWAGEDAEPYPIDEVLDSYAASRQAGGPAGVGGLLWALFDQLAEDVFDAVESLDDLLDDAEDVVFGADAGQTVPRDLFDLRRSLTALRRCAAPQRDVLAALLRSERALIGEAALDALERVHDHLLRVAELAEGQRDVLAGLLDAHLALAANRTNEVMKRTSSWGAILVVSTLVVGYYGMNFDLPELSWRFGWVWALGLLVATTGSLYLAFKRRGWL